VFHPNNPKPIEDHVNPRTPISPPGH
jgi:hypothetical protein